MEFLIHGVSVMIKRRHGSPLPTIQEETEMELEVIAQEVTGVAKGFVFMTYSRMLAERPDEFSEFIDWWIVTNRRQPDVIPTKTETEFPTEAKCPTKDRKDSFNFVGKWKRGGKWKRFKRFVSKLIFGKAK